MKRSLILLAVPLTLALGGCVTDGYGYGSVGYGSPYAYDGYYDGYYGSIYDGYWGNDGFFYYRSGANVNRYRRGDRAHFGRQPGNGGNWQHVQGTMQPSHGMHMPSFPRDGGKGGRHH